VAFSLKPTIRAKKVQDINFDELKELGVKLVIFDIDDTLIPRPIKDPSPEILEWIQTVKDAGFQICIMTNNNLERSKSIPGEYGIHHSLKPFKIKFKRVLKKYGMSPKETCMVGDKLFTDILGANRMGMHSVLVDKLR
jgi:hypothetical protein